MTPYEKFVQNYDGENLTNKHLLISIKNKERQDKREQNIKLAKNIIIFFLSYWLFVKIIYYFIY